MDLVDGAIIHVDTKRMTHYNPLCKNRENDFDCQTSYEIFRQGGKSKFMEYGKSWIVHPNVLLNEKPTNLHITDIAQNGKRIMGRVIDSRLGRYEESFVEEDKFDTRPSLWVHIEKDIPIADTPSHLRIPEKSMKYLKRFNRNCEERFENLTKMRLSI